MPRSVSRTWWSLAIALVLFVSATREALGQG